MRNRIAFLPDWLRALAVLYLCLVLSLSAFGEAGGQIKGLHDLKNVGPNSTKDLTATDSHAGGVSRRARMTGLEQGFEPISDTILPGGTYSFDYVNISKGIMVTVTGDVLISVTEDLNIAGILAGDCFAINLQVLGNITITGTVDNRCSGDPSTAGDLTIHTHGGTLAIGSIDTPAETHSSGNLDISNDPSLEEWEFAVLPYQRSATLLPPACSASVDTLVDMIVISPTEVVFYGEAVDPDGGPVTYEWDFGDGGSADERDPVHSYTSWGMYDVTLTVTDDDNQTCRATLRIVIDGGTLNFPPEPAVSAEPADLVVEAGQLALFYSEALDPQGEDLVYQWDLGDGTISTEAHPTHTYSAAGRYSITLTITDTDGISSSVISSLYVFENYDAFLPYVPNGFSGVSSAADVPDQNACLVGGANVFNTRHDAGQAAEGRNGRRLLYRGRGNIVLGPGLDLKAQDGGDGADKTGSGTVIGGRGGRGGSLYVLVAGQLTICGGAQFKSGSGGEGGDATSFTPPPDRAHARGGNGGKAGRRLSIKATRGMTFLSPLGNPVIVNPGNGGNGGDALALGGDGAIVGCAGEDGARATARGGNGGRASKTVVVTGRPTGLDNVEIQGGLGGNGGETDATAGDGGSPTCPGSATGGEGKAALARGGRGGDARLSGSTRGFQMSNDAFTGGDGSPTYAYGGWGGFAIATPDGSCGDASATGGNGDMATAYGGRGGKGRIDGNGGDSVAEGGWGGDAEATGDNCTDCVAGGAAVANAGHGSDAIARIGRAGGRSGTPGAITATAGFGGDAFATGGNGGDCATCPGGAGGAGGAADAVSGDGGDASGSGGGSFSGGDSGDAIAVGGLGGTGATCCEPVPAQGGDGGEGGGATSTVGNPGSPNGNNGINGGTGGDGGDGGDGEPAGSGGAAGIGTGIPTDIPDGAAGNDGGGCPCDPVDQADFSWNQPIYPGQVVTFTGWATGTFPITFTWDFGDGGTAEGNPVTHVFEMAMDYLVTMTATNACGQEVIVYTVVVEEPPCDPVHNTGFFWVPELPSVGDVVTFTAWASGTAPIDFFWTFGDGATAVGEVVNHTYQVAGYFTVTLEATNACGQETVSQVVVVQPPGCGEAIENGDFELGPVDWTKSSAGGDDIITNLTDFPVADNTTEMPWTLQEYWLRGFSSLAGQAIQIQFQGITNESFVTSFVLDVVSLDIACGAGAALPARARPSIREMNP